VWVDDEKECKNAKSRSAFQDGNFEAGGAQIQISRCIPSAVTLTPQGVILERVAFQRGNIYPAGCKVGTCRVPEWDT
jgi:hypothetical protein